MMKTFAAKVDGIPTDIVISSYSNKTLIVITQTGKFGSIIQVEKQVVRPFDSSENVFDIRTLFGKDDQEDHVLVRILAETVASNTPLIFVLNLKKRSYATTKTLIRILSALKV